MLLEKLKKIRDLLDQYKSIDNSDLEKGVAKRLFPYNPSDTPNSEKKVVKDWTVYEDGSAKDSIPKLEGNARLRALHKLSSATKTRRNPETGEREFLLHRGKTPSDAINRRIGNSFTPDMKIAEAFGRVLYSGDIDADYGEDRVPTEEEIENWSPSIFSGWIPESAIHHIPKILGNLGEGRGSAQYSDEFETIIDSNWLSQNSDNLERAPISDFKKKFTDNSIHGRINQRQKTQEAKQRLKNPGNKRGYIHKSFYKLKDDLEKGRDGDWGKEGYTVNHMWPSDDDLIINFFDKDGNESATFHFETLSPGDITIIDSYTKEPHRRKGIATHAYKMAEKMLNGKIIPLENQQSKDALSLWGQSNRKDKFGKSLKEPKQYDLGEGFTLSEKPWIESLGYYGNPRKYWEINHESSKKPVGKFLIDSDGENHTMSHSFVEKNYRNKGLGTSAYKKLIDHYGSLMSDDNKTSRSARRVWEKLGAEKLGTQNRGKQNKDRYVATSDRSLKKSQDNHNIIFYSDGDNVGSQVEKATLTDDLEKVVQIAKKINEMGDILEKHVLNLGGTVINRGGDDFLAVIPKSSLDRLEEARREIKLRTGFTNTIGAGDTPTKAAKALIWGKLNGKDQISKWSYEKEHELKRIVKNRSPEEKAVEILSGE